MLFNSFEFLLFFPVVTIIYFLLPHKFRWFHPFVPIYILILLGTIIIDYIAGIMIENASGAQRKWFLVMSIVANVGVLAFFKYYNFFVGNINYISGLAHINSYVPLLNILLPIGLSFHTFQAMSYTIEVYRGNQKAERHFGIYSLYVMFYPQLVAGPIERPQNLLYQFHAKHKFEYENLVKGMRLILWGLVKKVVIADRLAISVDQIFDHPTQNSGIVFAIGILFFTFQIFCDFSGYSDIAIGTARVMGFHLMTNFNMPYHSRSISEFWRRWHISLSTWFRDYLYISLGGNRVSIPRMYFNLFFVFLISGFWHGANWTFIIWGSLHGIYLVSAMLTRPIREKINKRTGIERVHWLNNTTDVLINFTLVAFAWIFFRANNIKDGFYIARKLGAVPHELVTIFLTRKVAFLKLPSILNVLMPCFGLILFLEIAHIMQLKYHLKDTFGNKPLLIRWSLYFSGMAAIYILGVHDKHQFIYFQF
jgi:alginate O-acetyltransferase complex protein AlgI